MCSPKAQADLLALLDEAVQAEERYRNALKDEGVAVARSRDAHQAACQWWGTFFAALDQSFPQGSACQDFSHRRNLVQGGTG